MPTQLCPFCLPADGRVAFVEPLFKGLWDAFPVTEGHLLLVPHRHVPSWSDLHVSEQAALTSGIEQARALISARCGADGFNVGFNDGKAAGQTVPHFHLHIIPRRHGDMTNPAGGVRHVIPAKGNYLAKPGKGDGSAPFAEMGLPHDRALIAGAEDSLIKHLLPHIDRATHVDVAVSFTMESGIRLLRPHLQDLLDRQGHVRFVTGDYLDVTDPDALRRLMDLEGEISRHVFEAGTIGFHTKSWIFHFADGTGVALVGSSNLSESALVKGVEWNYRVFTPNQQGGWRDVLDGFEALLARPEIKPLSHEWISGYERRRQKPPSSGPGGVGVPEDPPLPMPEPHAIQKQALAALEETRRRGFTAGLVVLATGLGKTWLSAFDSNRAKFGRILFVAHREEILTQAMEAFRVSRPHASLGRYTGTDKDRSADILFASIQTLGRAAHLRHFSPDAFDYIIVDEFHHAAAKTYRRLIDHFTPKFLLGLTATPDRMDGGDLLGLCQENLVFRCDAFEGIKGELLSPFHYFGVPDDVDYENIPWRSASFDETALTSALATQVRAQNALDQLRLHGGQRTLGFCCSQRHADFMADFFRKQDLRAVSVHAGSGSAPRTSSLAALQAGDLDVVFAVDMFNEGVDVPNIDTVLMLRPTESTTIWMQQFGRGLRRAAGKDRLHVIDYIGNHRTFLTKAQALLNCGGGPRQLAIALDQVRADQFELPPGCAITYDLKAMDILQNLLKPTRQGDALDAYYAAYRDRFGTRPTALEIFHAGFNPRTNGHGSWFDYVGHHNDLTDQERRVAANHSAFLDSLSKTQMTKSYKMLLLQAMQQEGALPGQIEIARLTKRFAGIAGRHPVYRGDVSVPLDDQPGVQRLLEKHPIDAWINGRGTSGRTFFAYDNGVLRTTFSVSEDLSDCFNSLVQEAIDWRLAEYLDRRQKNGPEDDNPPPDAPPFSEDSTQPTGAVLWHEYMREEIPPLYRLVFSTGSWNQGFVVQGRDVFLLVTLDKSGNQEEHQYDDGFLGASHFKWQSQNQTLQSSQHGKIIQQTAVDYDIHLFVRPTKKRGKGACPFIYCGDVDFQEWQGERPITVTWKLRNPVPTNLHRLLDVKRVSPPHHPS